MNAVFAVVEWLLWLSVMCDSDQWTTHLTHFAKAAVVWYHPNSAEIETYQQDGHARRLLSRQLLFTRDTTRMLALTL